MKSRFPISLLFFLEHPLFLTNALENEFDEVSPSWNPYIRLDGSCPLGSENDPRVMRLFRLGEFYFLGQCLNGDRYQIRGPLPEGIV